jgi:hypothetical protein
MVQLAGYFKEKVFPVYAEYPVLLVDVLVVVGNDCDEICAEA